MRYLGPINNIFVIVINFESCGLHFCRLFCGIDDIYCLFLGSLNNLSILNKQYGLSKGTDEAMFVIEAYKTLRDRSPYPADQVVKELDGSFAFVVYDSKNGGVFAALVYMLIYHVFLFC
jgi:hypothetical protein